MDKLLSEGIIPDVLDQLPECKLEIYFGENHESEVNYGNQFPIKAVNYQPTKISWLGDDTKYYTLCLTDPDAPTRSAPSMKERAHWMLTNIPGNSVSKCDTLMSFVPSCPPKDSGLHRYTFVVLEQPSKLDFSGDAHLEKWDNRKQFSIRNFAKKYNMKEKAVATNFYYAEWDQDAQITRESLGLV